MYMSKFQHSISVIDAQGSDSNAKNILIIGCDHVAHLYCSVKKLYGREKN